MSESTTIEPGNRATLWPSANPALAGQGFSTVVESDQPVVAERAMYFDNFRSGHDALGVTSGRTTWYFAEGFTGGSATIASRPSSSSATTTRNLRRSPRRSSATAALR